MDAAQNPQIRPFYDETLGYFPDADDLPNAESPHSSSSSELNGQPSDPLSGVAGGSVARRNERERKRVKMVNMGFAKLRQYVPLATRGKRLSKVETLRSAIDYIRQLRQLLLYHQQQPMEDPVYYHLCDHPHPLYHHQPPHQQPMYQPFELGPQRNQGYYYDGMGSMSYAADGAMECGSGWSVSSESPCSSVESETSPQCLQEPDHELPCWTV